MRIENGFFVNNFVGNYEMLNVPDWDCTMIVSKEVNHAVEDAGERPLQKKRIFDSDKSKSDYISLQLANVNIHEDASILEFCGKYGLPYSSQICADKENGIGPDISPELAVKISKQAENSLFGRKDTMDRLEFCRHAVFVRRLLELKDCLDRRDKISVAKELIPLLTYFVFYSREYIYDYCAKEQLAPDVLPKTRTMNFQYCFQWFRRQNAKIIDQFSPAYQIVLFLAQYEYRLNHPGSVYDPMLLSDISAEDNRQVLNLFKRIFIKDFFSKELLAAGQPPNIIFDIDRNETNVLSNVEALKYVRNQFCVDENNSLTFDEPPDDISNPSELIQLGYIVIRDVINEGMTRIMPELVWDGRNMRGEWQLNFQMEGIYMELFFQMAANTMYHRCENPKCRNFFVISEGKSTKKYCCDNCSAAYRQARRRERQKGQIRL